MKKRIASMMATVIAVTGLSAGAAALADAPLVEYTEFMGNGRVEVEFVGDVWYENAQVTAGGLTGFDPDTLESRAIPGLFAAGELLDVDGPCGGYNLQWAWASALLAARSILQKRKGGIPSA